MTTNLNLIQSSEVSINNLYAIDFLKVEVQVSNRPKRFSNKITFPCTKDVNGEYQQLNPSYGKKVIEGSFSSLLTVKAKDRYTMIISGNFFKWLNGHNVTGSTDICQLVADTVQRLNELEEGITLQENELEAIKQGSFQIFRIDLNKAIVCDGKVEALNHLDKLIEYAQHRRLKKSVEKNGVYFGLGSKRVTFVYYHKGTELKKNSTHQFKLTDQLQAYADCTVRFEVRLFRQELVEDRLGCGYQWSSGKVESELEDRMASVIQPKPTPYNELPAPLMKFVAVHKMGTVVETYKTSVIRRYKRTLRLEHGIVL